MKNDISLRERLTTSWRAASKTVESDKMSSEKELHMIQPTASFKNNLQLLPLVDGVERLDLVDPEGQVVASILNQPGKQGSLCVYQYLDQTFGIIDAKAAAHGLAVFGEHTEDAKLRPGAHPNIDLLTAILDGGNPLSVRLTTA